MAEGSKVATLGPKYNLFGCLGQLGVNSNLVHVAPKNSPEIFTSKHAGGASS